jgi:bacteriocin biosynthesis cyclodehydratase domain-containing protein
MSAVRPYRESPPLPARPVLKPALRRLWRDGDVLQLGIDPQHAVVLTGVGSAELRLLDLLDGTRDTDAVLVDASRAGWQAEQAQRLVVALHDAGLLDDAALTDAPDERERQRLLPDRLSLSVRHRAPGAADRVLRLRREASVVVHGAGRVGAAVAALLASAGVARIGCVDEGRVRAADLSPAGIPLQSTGSRASALMRRLRGTAPTTSVGAPVAAPTFAVVAPTGTVAAPETLAAVRDLPHLLVVVRATSAAVGPLVLPGRTPCIRCLELSRGDRDRGWPTLAAQLAWSPRTVDPCDLSLATLAASMASLHALTWIDTAGESPPASCGGLLDYDLLDGRLRRRTVRAHPDCGCGAAPDIITP